jgi:hypothetical protein
MMILYRLKMSCWWRPKSRILLLSQCDEKLKCPSSNYRCLVRWFLPTIRSFYLVLKEHTIRNRILRILLDVGFLYRSLFRTFSLLQSCANLFTNQIEKLDRLFSLFQLFILLSPSLIVLGLIITKKKSYNERKQVYTFSFPNQTPIVHLPQITYTSSQICIYDFFFFIHIGCLHPEDQVCKSTTTDSIKFIFIVKTEKRVPGLHF